MEGMSLRAFAPLVAGLMLLAIASPSFAAGKRLTPFEGSIHEHTGYSDGAPDTRPADAFAAVRGYGEDFMALTEHSDTFAAPIVTNTDCVGPQLPGCVLPGDQPLDSLRKWPAMAEQANAATTGDFVGIRGFEWTNDRHGHISVLSSQNNTNAKIDGSYLSMRAFWRWFTRPVDRGGGADALGTFNHPGRRELGELVPGGLITSITPDIPMPGSDWDAFEYIPEADERMVGIELFNGGGDYGDADENHPAGAYGEALDKGWHLGAIGAEDTHNRSWGVPEERKTVVLANRLTRPALRRAMLERHFYAVRSTGMRIGFTADHEPMGSRLRRRARTPVTFRARAAGARIDLVTSGGQVVAKGKDRLVVRRSIREREKWYFARVRQDGESIAYSSPIWVESR